MKAFYVVGTPIGNLEDLSPRALRILETSDLILAEDTRHTRKLLSHFGLKTPMQSYHKFNEIEQASRILQRMIRENLQVALVSDAGVPCISDPGAVIVRGAREQGMEVIGIPGPCAAVTGLSVSGLNTDSFSFFGFLPRDHAGRGRRLEDIRQCPTSTVILYESPKRIVETAAELAREFPGSMVCYCCDLTKLHEKSRLGTVEEMAEALKNDEKSGLGEYTILLEKKEQAFVQEETPSLSLEALLVEKMTVEGCTLKQAVSILSSMPESPRKKEWYQAGLRLKELFSESV